MRNEANLTSSEPDLPPDLLLELHRIGVFQFGRFARDNGNPPRTFDTYQLQTGLIASYPAVLALAAERLSMGVRDFIHELGTPIEYLYCTPESLPLATAVSLRLNMPLTYPSPGKDGHIEGAFDYDIPTVMITDVLTPDRSEQMWVKLGESAGLRMKALLALISADGARSIVASEVNFPVGAVFPLPRVRTELIKLGYLPETLEDVP